MLGMIKENAVEEGSWKRTLQICLKSGKVTGISVKSQRFKVLFLSKFFFFSWIFSGCTNTCSMHTHTYIHPYTKKRKETYIKTKTGHSYFTILQLKLKLSPHHHHHHHPNETFFLFISHCCITKQRIFNITFLNVLILFRKIIFYFAHRSKIKNEKENTNVKMISIPSDANCFVSFVLNNI